MHFISESKHAYFHWELSLFFDHVAHHTNEVTDTFVSLFLRVCTLPRIRLIWIVVHRSRVIHGKHDSRPRGFFGLTGIDPYAEYSHNDKNSERNGDR
jgi:hypothetical protein